MWDVYSWYQLGRSPQVVGSQSDSKWCIILKFTSQSIIDHNYSYLVIRGVVRAIGFWNRLYITEKKSIHAWKLVIVVSRDIEIKPEYLNTHRQFFPPVVGCETKFHPRYSSPRCGWLVALCHEAFNVSFTWLSLSVASSNVSWLSLCYEQSVLLMCVI